MAAGRPRYIRDPIHGLIRFDGSPRDTLLWQLVHTPEFQRLRRIKQLGFSDAVFPGATHTRFSHSLGVLWNAKRFLDQIERSLGETIDAIDRTVIEVAALLHDIGHGPFSHAFEKITEVHHEKRTAEIVLASSTEVNEILRGFDVAPELDRRVATLFPKGEAHLQAAGGIEYECPIYLQQVIDSQFDADRTDYLLRDSHFSGCGYGAFDLLRLIENLHVSKEYNVLFFGEKSLQEVEQYVFARYHMYQAVYYHRATRAAEVMLRELFRYLVESKKLDVLSGIADDRLKRLLLREGSLDDFLTADDHSITEMLKAGTRIDDNTVQFLSSGILNRRFLKCIDASNLGSHVIGKFRESVLAVISKSVNLPLDAEHAFAADTPSDTPYTVVMPDENPAKQLLIGDTEDALKPIHAFSDVVDALRKRITKLRFYFPEELRSEIEEIEQ